MTNNLPVRNSVPHDHQRGEDTRPDAVQSGQHNLYNITPQPSTNDPLGVT